MSGNGAFSFRHSVSHCTLMPITRRSAATGALISLKRARASRPYIVSQPARRETMASPVASQKRRALTRVTTPERVSRARTAEMRFVCTGSISTAKTCWR